jgi:hypothetical protein
MLAATAFRAASNGRGIVLRMTEHSVAVVHTNLALPRAVLLYSSG